MTLRILNMTSVLLRQFSVHVCHLWLHTQCCIANRKHFFIYLFVFLGKMSIQVFCLFSNQVTWFLLLSCMKWSEVAQSCPTLCDPMDCSLPGSSVHGILQARILKWVAISFSRGSSRPRDLTQVSHIVGRFFTIKDTWEAHRKNISPFYLVTQGNSWHRKNISYPLFAVFHSECCCY